MKKMLIAAALLCGIALPASAQQRQTYWDHSTNPSLGYSIMLMEQNGNDVIITYSQPRQSLLNIGIRSGNVLFHGKRNGNQFSGTAYSFNSNCRADGGVKSAPYNVSGSYVPRDRVITLEGPSPNWNGCDVVGRSWGNDTDTLEFLQR